MIKYGDKVMADENPYAALSDQELIDQWSAAKDAWSLRATAPRTRADRWKDAAWMCGCCFLPLALVGLFWITSTLVGYPDGSAGKAVGDALANVCMAIACVVTLIIGYFSFRSARETSRPTPTPWTRDLTLEYRFGHFPLFNYLEEVQSWSTADDAPDWILMLKSHDLPDGSLRFIRVSLWANGKTQGRVEIRDSPLGLGIFDPYYEKSQSSDFDTINTKLSIPATQNLLILMENIDLDLIPDMDQPDPIHNPYGMHLLPFESGYDCELGLRRRSPLQVKRGKTVLATTWSSVHPTTILSRQLLQLADDMSPMPQSRHSDDAGQVAI